MQTTGHVAHHGSIVSIVRVRCNFLNMSIINITSFVFAVLKNKLLCTHGDKKKTIAVLFVFCLFFDRFY